jgi:hypothetical protein
MRRHCTNPLIYRCGKCAGVLGRYQEGDEPADWFCIDCDRWRLSEPTASEALDERAAVLLALAAMLSEEEGVA